MPSPTRFLGEFEHAIDDRSRLAIPARFRPALEDGLYIARGMDRCLVIYDIYTGNAVIDRVDQLNEWQADARRLQRLFFSGAAKAHMDKLGRVVIPQFLRDYAQLENEVVVLGIGRRIEVWAKSGWEREREQTERDSAELAEHLSRPID